ncbi:MAG: hypothetical protein LBJ23_05670 [Tannerella sp.]|jgi:hypothetical protein|nr:hypothetical protein [Tannerella sp.]
MKSDVIRKIFSTVLCIGLVCGCIDDGRNSADEVVNGDVPELANLAFAGNTASTVVLKAEVVNANGYAVTERGFCWGTSPAPTTADSRLTVGDGKGEFSDTIKGLLGNTKYYFRAYAVNGRGTSYSDEDSHVTNSGLGKVRTLEVTSRRATTATGGGKIELYGEGEIVSYGLFKAASVDMAKKDTIVGANPIVADSFLCHISGLSADTRYYVQAFVRNRFGTFVGDPVSFSTGNGKPVIDEIKILDPSIDIGYTEVTVASGVLEAGDGPLRERGFCWSENPNPSIESAERVPCGSEIGPFVAQIEGLTSQRTYYFRAYAKNDFGTVYSDPQLVVQTKSQLPSLRTNLPVVNNSLGTVVAGGQILDQGRSPIIAKGVCYSSTSSAPSVTTGTTVDIGVNDAFSVELTGLRGETTYYLRAYARNSEGVSYGAEVMTFTTPQIFNGGLKPFPQTAPLEASAAYFMIGNRFYLLGGDMGASYTDGLWSYSRAEDDWRGLYQYHVAVKWPTAVGHGQSAYVLGGMIFGGGASDDFYQYALPPNSWYQMPKGPDAAYLRTGLAVDDDLYYFGGMGDTARSDVWAFHVSGGSGSWSKKTALPAAQYGGVAVGIDDAVYVGLGKNTAGTCNKALWKSTDGMESWSQATDNPLISDGVLAGVAFRGKIYVVDESHRIHEYDPGASLWRVKSQLPSSIFNVLCMYVLNDLIFVGFGNGSLVMYNPLWDN